MSEVLEKISEMLQKGKRKDVAKLCQQAIDEGLEPNVVGTSGRYGCRRRKVQSK